MTTELVSLEPVIDPNNRITFLLDWELTMKCNLDCTYCTTGLYGSHDNSIPHPDKSKCIQAIDFMFEYVDQYMMYKPNGIKYVILNVYGGEALAHPDIIEILEEVHKKYKPYKDRWHLTVTTTTNAILSKKTLDKIIPLIDEFTVSYHSENNNKQKQQFKDNLITISQSGKRMKCIVLMHHNELLFDDANEILNWLKEHNIRVLPKQLDLHKNETYNTRQIKWFNNLYKSKSYNSDSEFIPEDQQSANLTDLGRACCGGRQMCENQNYKERTSYVVGNQFSGWYCSVNWFFLFIKQVTGEIFVNKDCKMDFTGNVGPIGTLNNQSEVIGQLKNQLQNKTLPVIQCAKKICRCGLCAPKAKSIEDFNNIMKKYQK